MNMKTLLIGLAGGIVAFLTGFFVYGILMMEYFSTNTPKIPGLTKDPMEIWATGLGNIVWGILLSYIIAIAGIKSGAKGALNGAFIFFLFSLGTNIVFYSQYNIYTVQTGIVDALCMAVLGATSGALTGWLYLRTSA